MAATASNGRRRQPKGPRGGPAAGASGVTAAAVGARDQPRRRLYRYSAGSGAPCAWPCWGLVATHRGCARWPRSLRSVEGCLTSRQTARGGLPVLASSRAAPRGARTRGGDGASVGVRAHPWVCARTRGSAPGAWRLRVLAAALAVGGGGGRPSPRFPQQPAGAARLPLLPPPVRVLLHSRPAHAADSCGHASPPPPPPTAGYARPLPPPTTRFVSAASTSSRPRLPPLPVLSVVFVPSSAIDVLLHTKCSVDASEHDVEPRGHIPAHGKHELVYLDCESFRGSAVVNDKVGKRCLV